ncbi:hypothetical protein DFH08DRAFT_886256 [Mycena albidolilacea]|uniref:Uncharacterized protein n=1 Tax=Mycena albidolilacea TaxID=1033008 RepID=A0AAD7EI29_9AGAR|nr:hypothetical protein DFH08DRAFT_886256 [Mycena albidolilacea]
MAPSIPKLVAFELDGTFWRRDSAGLLQMRPSIPGILQDLYKRGVKMVICSRYKDKTEADNFFKIQTVKIDGRNVTLKKLIGKKYIIVKNVDKKFHFQTVHAETRIKFSDMILFDVGQNPSDNAFLTLTGIRFQQVGGSGLDWKTYRKVFPADDESSSEESESTTSDDRTDSTHSTDITDSTDRTDTEDNNIPDRYRSFTRRLINVTTGDWSPWSECIANTYYGDILWTDGNANYRFGEAPQPPAR